MTTYCGSLDGKDFQIRSALISDFPCGATVSRISEFLYRRHKLTPPLRVKLFAFGEILQPNLMFSWVDVFLEAFTVGENDMLQINVQVETYGEVVIYSCKPVLKKHLPLLVSQVVGMKTQLSKVVSRPHAQKLYNGDGAVLSLSSAPCQSLNAQEKNILEGYNAHGCVKGNFPFALFLRKIRVTCVDHQHGRISNKLSYTMDGTEEDADQLVHSILETHSADMKKAIGMSRKAQWSIHVTID